MSEKINRRFFVAAFSLLVWLRWTVGTRHILGMTPDTSKPKPPRAPVENSWEAGADHRDTDKIFDWEFYTAAEDRSLDRMHERHLREKAATRGGDADQRKDPQSRHLRPSLEQRTLLGGRRLPGLA
jgi:hypothetical protein